MLQESYLYHPTKITINGGDIISKLEPKQIVFLAIAIIIMVSVMPSAINTVYETNTSNWAFNGAEDTKVTAIWWLLPLIIVAGIILSAFGVFLFWNELGIDQDDYYEKK